MGAHGGAVFSAAPKQQVKSLQGVLKEPLRAQRLNTLVTLLMMLRPTQKFYASLLGQISHMQGVLMVMQANAV